jgi:heptose I phosphotransferase
MTGTLWQRLFRGVCRLRQQPYWTDFAGLNWPQRIMAESVTDRLHAKQGRTIARWTLENAGRRLVVYLKRHYRLPWWHGLFALFWPEGNWSPAMQEWQHLEWARAAGLPVPVPAAGGEFIGPWGRLQSFLAVEELPSMVALHQAIPLAANRLDPLSFRRWKRGLVGQMVSLAQALHRRRCFHKDFYLCHFYIHQDDTGCLPDWRGRVHLIDLHRFGRHAWTAPWWRVKDLSQLLFSSHVPGVDARDQLWFWRLYCGPSRRGRLARWQRQIIRVKAWNYQRREARQLKKTA